MTNPMTRVNTKIKRVFKTTASVILIAAMAFTMGFGSGSTAYAAEAEEQNEVWAITIGDEEILYVDSEEAGKQVIEGLKNYYLSEGSTVVEDVYKRQVDRQ